MTTPGVVTIPQVTPPPEKPPTVLATGRPKSVITNPHSGELQVVHHDGVVTGNKVTIDGVTVLTPGGGALTNGQVTVHH